jgi:hypothetical protein
MHLDTTLFRRAFWTIRSIRAVLRSISFFGCIRNALDRVPTGTCTTWPIRFVGHWLPTPVQLTYQFSKVAFDLPFAPLGLPPSTSRYPHGQRDIKSPLAKVSLRNPHFETVA